MVKFYNSLIHYLLNEKVIFSIHNKNKIIVYYINQDFQFISFNVLFNGNQWFLDSQKPYCFNNTHYIRNRFNRNQILREMNNIERNLFNEVPISSCPINPHDIIVEFNKSPNTIQREIIEFYNTLEYSGSFVFNQKLPIKSSPNNLFTSTEYSIYSNNEKIVQCASNHLYLELFFDNIYKFLDKKMSTSKERYFFENKIKPTEFYYDLILFCKKIVGNLNHSNY